MDSLALTLIKKNLETKDPFLDLGNCGLRGDEPELELLRDCEYLETLYFSNEWIDYEVRQWKTSRNKGPKNRLKQIPVNLPSNLKVLYLTGNQLTDISVLSGLTGLIELDIGSNQVTDISQLSGLKGLKELNLHDNHLRDISGLSDLTGLTQLDLGKNQLKDISVLSVMTGLRELGLGNIQLTDISVLTGLTGLKDLGLEHNQLTDISVLSGLTGLRNLGLEQNQIMDISALSGLTALKVLNLGSNYLTDISVLSNLAGLTELDLYNNQLTDISCLSCLTGLSQLDLGKNRIKDISVLSGLTDLRDLSLEINQLSDISVMSDLTGLTDLNLSGNQITGISVLSGLTQLTKLNLSGNQLTNITVLSGLPSLTSLDLGRLPSVLTIFDGNQLTDMSVLSGLIDLTELILDGYQLTDISFLSELTHLNKLNLSNNQLTDISDLSSLTCLTELYLSGNQLTDISVLTELPDLNKLNLSNNQLTDITDLSSLTCLTELYLYGNQLTDISCLTGLIGLSELNLGYNRLKDLSVLPGLTDLRYLGLESNQLTDITVLSRLSCLTELNLSGNELTDISVLSELTNLRYLDLGNNQLTDITVLSRLSCLTELNLSGNELTDISCLSGLIGLSELNLGYNQLKDISVLSGLTGLTKIDLQNNQISEFTLKELDYFPSLQKLYLYGNPIKNIPKEIFHKSFPNVFLEVKNYLEDKERGASPNREVKVIFIGNGSVGKTQIAKRLVEKENFIFEEKHDSTHGISLLQTSVHSSDLILNLWDFGGQDLYHATHRLFMQTRALFILVWDFENENNSFHNWDNQQYRNLDLKYWLSYAEQFGKGSPVLVVQNKVDNIGDEDTEISQPEKKRLKEDFPSIVDFWACSAKTGHHFEILEDMILEAFKGHAKFRQEILDIELPDSWIQLREKVRSLQSQKDCPKQMRYEEFLNWSKEAGTERSTDTILKFFHDTGVLYFQRNFFKGSIVLDQNWAIEAVYKLLDRKKPYAKFIQSKNGVITYRDIRKIWSEPENNEDERKLFIGFLLDAELCFETGNKFFGKEFSQRQFVVPQLLREERPILIDSYIEKHNLKEKVSISYSFLPTVFIHRFIVRICEFAKVEDMWQSGIYFNYNSKSAVVEADYSEKKINIFYPPSLPKLLEAIKEEFKKISSNIPSMEEGVEDTLAWSFRKVFEITRQGDEKYENNILNSTLQNHPNMEKKEFRIFISYSSKDQKLRKIIEKELKGHLKHKEDIKYSLWSDEGIDGGQNWRESLHQAMKNSNAAILLISSNFASSEFIDEIELQEFLNMQNKDGFLILPVLAREYDFSGFKEISELQFFKPYHRDFGFTELDIRDDLLPFDKLADDKETTDAILHRYFSKLSDFIHTSVKNKFSMKRENINNSNYSDQKVVRSKSTEEILQLINEDIVEALGILHEILGRNNGTFNDLYKEYINRPNNFETSSYRDRLKLFVRFNLDK